ncbi:hypothetical protein F5Y18DRAFT_427360 [Xylariaceae sp. FL1019]|nr:hypothetical protein F5Y18DRAFT_427360 [Xylariaceae sp. FL1019]
MSGQTQSTLPGRSLAQEDERAGVAKTPAPMPRAVYSACRSPAWQPTCTHLTMTRMYDLDSYCVMCRRPVSTVQITLEIRPYRLDLWGHSLQDRELLIADALEKDHPVSFDLLGLELGSKIVPGLRSPEKRASKLSFFDEITAEAMSTYAPAQIAAILQQRDNLHGVLSQYSHQVPSSPFYSPLGVLVERQSLLRPPPGFGFPDKEQQKPWVPSSDQECKLSRQAKYCQRCRPSCEARSYLGLSGIVDGDVPPTAATGFGFHRIGTRPIVDVDVIRYIGLRAVPLPRVTAGIVAPHSSATSEPSISKSIGIHKDDVVTSKAELTSKTSDGSQGDEANSSVSHQWTEPRPAWSPPPTPMSWTGLKLHKNGASTFENRPFVCDGRSPDSLKTNESVHQQVITSIDGLINQELDEEQTAGYQSLLRPASCDTPDSDGGPAGTITPMLQEEMREGRFHEQALELSTGVAVLVSDPV